VASGTAVRSQTRESVVTMRRRKWREGKVRPIPGNSPHDRLVSRVIFSSLKESLRRSLPRHSFPHLETILGAQYAFLRHVGIYLVRCGQLKTKSQTKPRGGRRATSRWSAPSPGSRTCREDHAPSHRPQMSSGRLFLDRVARQHCPSPLHRHAQTTTPPRPALRKPDISTLQRIGHFYFALTLTEAAKLSATPAGRARQCVQGRADAGCLRSGAEPPVPRCAAWPRTPGILLRKSSPAVSVPLPCVAPSRNLWEIRGEPSVSTEALDLRSTRWNTPLFPPSQTRATTERSPGCP